MKKYTRMGIVFLMSALMLVFASCGISAIKEETAKETTKETTIETTIPVAKAIDPLGMYEPGIEIKAAMIAGPQLQYPQDENLDDNLYIRLYKEKLGITLKYDWVASNATEYEQKLNVNIASGLIPDVFHITIDKLKQLVDADMLSEMEETYKYLLPEIQKSMESTDITIKAAKYNEKLMAIPEPVEPNYSMSWVRTDWMEKLGLTEPKSIEDVVKIAETFVNNDPDGNGKNDTLGLPIQNTLWGWPYCLENFFCGFESYPTIWVQDESGNLSYGSILPETRNALAKLQEMYKAGLIDKEFAVKNSTAVMKDVNAGLFGIMYYGNAAPVRLKDFRTNFPNSDWKPVALPSVSGKPALTQQDVTPGKFWVVRKDYKNPEALAKLINVKYDISFINADSKYFIDENGVQTQFLGLDTRFYPYQKNIASYEKISALLSKGSTESDGLNVEQKIYWDAIMKFKKDGDVNGWNYNRIYGIDGAMGVSKYGLENNLFKFSQFNGAAGKAMAANWSTLSGMRNEVFTKIIMGAASVDEFDKFVADWKKMGGDEVTKEINEWYQKQK